MSSEEYRPVYGLIKIEDLSTVFMGGTQRVSLGEVSVDIMDDGDWAYMHTINSICIKSYQGKRRLYSVVGDINKLRRGEGIDL